jgi:uncharacterized protein (TIGR00725 family)
MEIETGKMRLRDRTRIGVMGPAVCSPRTAALAREVGRLIARAGGILICGGRSGVMDAAAAGARSEGGLTVGILPGDCASEANAHIDIPIVTGMGNGRNVVNVLTSQSIIAIHGGPGTLSEIALALKCDVPVIGLESWSLRSPEGNPPAGFTAARSPEEAVEIALRKARSSGS